MFGGSPVGSFPTSRSDLGSTYRTQRTVPRYTFVAVAEIIEAATQTCVMGRISEISRKGCYVDTLDTFPLGTHLNVVISRDHGTFATQGNVIYTHEGVGMGVAFHDPTHDQLRILDSWLAQHSLTDTL
jgi:PilZ domain